MAVRVLQWPRMAVRLAPMRIAARLPTARWLATPAVRQPAAGSKGAEAAAAAVPAARRSVVIAGAQTATAFAKLAGVRPGTSSESSQPGAGAAV